MKKVLRYREEGISTPEIATFAGPSSASAHRILSGNLKVQLFAISTSTAANFPIPRARVDVGHLIRSEPHAAEQP